MEKHTFILQEWSTRTQLRIKKSSKFLFFIQANLAINSNYDKKKAGVKRLYILDISLFTSEQPIKWFKKKTKIKKQCFLPHIF